MKTIIILLCCLLIGTQQGAPVKEFYDFTIVDSYLKEEASTKKSKWNGYPKGYTYPDGLALLVIKDDQVLYDKGYYGLTSTSKIPIASGSKLVAAVSMMRAVHQKKLSLDTPVSQFLPKFKGKKGQALMRQLFSHTAGFPEDHELCLNFDITLAECVDGLSSISLKADPGKEARYGAVSMQIAARMVEIATDKDWQTWFQDEVAKPLGMINTDWEAHLYTRNPRIAGAVSSTASDYAKLLQMLMRQGSWKGKSFLTRKEVDEITSDQVKQAKIINFDQNFRYGLGCFLETYDKNKKGIIVSCPGSSGFYAWIDREHQLVCILSATCGWEEAGVVYRKLQPMIANVVHKYPNPLFTK